MKNVLKQAGGMAAGLLPAALLAHLGMPALAALVFLAVLVLGVICWIVSNDDRCERVSRIMLARRGNARCLKPGEGTARRPSRANAKLSRGYDLITSTPGTRGRRGCGSCPRD